MTKHKHPHPWQVRATLTKRTQMEPKKPGRPKKLNSHALQRIRTEEEGPLSRESVASIEYNRGKPPDWAQWAEYKTLTARQAVLLMHGLNPKCQNKTGPLVLTPRALSLSGTSARVREIEHQIRAAESKSTKRLSAKKWFEWCSAKPREWEVGAEFRQLTAAQVTPALAAKSRGYKSNKQIDALELPKSGTGTIRDLIRVVEKAHGIGGDV
jgi:hypothetical protein